MDFIFLLILLKLEFEVYQKHLLMTPLGLKARRMCFVLGRSGPNHADLAHSLTRLAGPGRGSPSKPVGTVWLAWATPDGVVSAVQHFAGDRHAVRQATVQRSLQGLLKLLGPPA